MAPNPRRVDERLQALYDQVPDVPCTGACHGACCFIQASVRERQRMEAAAGKPLDTVDACAPGGAGAKVAADGSLLARFRCSMLTDDGRCGVYEQRPMICRLFGAVEGMECHAGCAPDRLLPLEEGLALVQDAMHTGGLPPDTEKATGDQIRRAAAADPGARAELVRAVRELRERGNRALAAGSPLRRGDR